MKFTILRDDIHAALQAVASVVPQRSTIAMTQNILISAENQRISLMATDLEITIHSWAGGEIEQEGRLAVPGKLLSDIIRELPNVNITFESDENFRLQFHSEFGEYKVAGEDPSNFPQMPQIEEFRSVHLNNDVLRKLIENTIFSTSRDELRPALTGVYFELEGQAIRTVATDGHRLAMYRCQLPDAPETEARAIISTRALQFVLRNLDGEGLTEMKLGEKHAMFQFGTTELFARLIDEAFVDYQRVIPAETNFKLEVETSRFFSSAKRVSLFSNPITAQIILRLYASSMQLLAEDVDYGGQAKEQIPCEFNGEEFIIGFNSSYLQEVLRHIDAEKVVLEFIRPDYAVLAKPVDSPEEEEQLMLLMPVRLDQV